MPKLKLDEGTGFAVVQDGKVVVVHDDGKEQPTDVLHVISKLPEVNSEAARHRKRADELEASLKGFEGLDAEKARKALETVAGLDAKKLIDAGKADEMLAQRIADTKAAYDKQLAEAKASVEARDGQIRQLVIGSAFMGAAALKGTIYEGLPDAAESYFGRYFRVENGKPVGYYDPGTWQRPIQDPARPGDVATFDAALAALIESNPNKDRIRLATGSGGGAPAARTSGGGTSATISRSEAEDPRRYRAAKEAAQKAGLELTIVG